MQKTPFLALMAFFCFTVTIIVPGTAEAVVVSSACELANAIEESNSGGDKTIILEGGTYTVDYML